ncbi:MULTISPECIES: GNAT family N-acetyltransferase [unclassified Imperialibacter]|uniref:GNAT family N-acetyltransferase n=1 Tax=unclassified Imperialibacter TaxID=2629706 RepID=UPI00125C5772|nr:MULTISPECIES: GNAT family N-acetyltransferase [unclassified Imperialibacter]CAD5256140.1 hypothetical protein IMPERIA89_230098 [Imperialibacter sp. 89]CAD5262235.1 hypothetical protein IMPERIA75_280098 [Imperialibacter sp. 75]VVT33123.1 hypothetical protein IMPR6_60233 [Imperialibacter sp. EC-SDR9]
MTERGHIKLRTATIQDLPLLLHWDEQPHVIASDPDDEWGWESELKKTPPWREQLVAELDGRPIGFVQIIDPEKENHTIGAMCHPTFGPLTFGSANRPILAGDTAPK